MVFFWPIAALRIDGRGNRTTPSSHLTASSKGLKYTGSTSIGEVTLTYLQGESYLSLFGVSELDYEYDFDMELDLNFSDQEVGED